MKKSTSTVLASIFLWTSLTASASSGQLADPFGIDLTSRDSCARMDAKLKSLGAKLEVDRSLSDQAGGDPSAMLFKRFTNVDAAFPGAAVISIGCEFGRIRRLGIHDADPKADLSAVNETFVSLNRKYTHLQTSAIKDGVLHAFKAQGSTIDLTFHAKKGKFTVIYLVDEPYSADHDERKEREQKERTLRQTAL